VRPLDRVLAWQFCRGCAPRRAGRPLASCTASLTDRFTVWRQPHAPVSSMSGSLGLCLGSAASQTEHRAIAESVVDTASAASSRPALDGHPCLADDVEARVRPGSRGAGRLCGSLRTVPARLRTFMLLPEPDPASSRQVARRGRPGHARRRERRVIDLWRLAEVNDHYHVLRGVERQPEIGSSRVVTPLASSLTSSRR
jgi:hypothetical protein